MENKIKDGKCVFCGHSELVNSEVAFPQKRRVMPVSLRRDGKTDYVESEYADFKIKRCKSCGYIHMFFHPDPFNKSTIR